MALSGVYWLDHFALVVEVQVDPWLVAKDHIRVDKRLNLTPLIIHYSKKGYTTRTVDACIYFGLDS
jgi:hypothetical protein